MKKLILALVIGVTFISFAQTTGKAVGSGYVWTDSLGYGSVAASDSVWIINLNFSNGWYRVFFEGNTNSPVDSVYLQLGSIRYNQAKVAVDTVWGSWTTLKDSVWGDINTMVNNTVGKDFLVFSPVAQLARFTLLNDRITLVTRNSVLTLQAVRK